MQFSVINADICLRTERILSPHFSSVNDFFSDSRQLLNYQANQLFFIQLLMALSMTAPLGPDKMPAIAKLLFITVDIIAPK